MNVRRRFFFMLFIAFFICVSIVLPNYTGRQIEYDFKIPGAAPVSVPDAIISPGSVMGFRFFDTDSPAGSSIDSIGGLYKKISKTETPEYARGFGDIDGGRERAGGGAAGSDADRVNGGAGYVILDAGHGGSDPGTIDSGVQEKEIALEVALLTAALLDEAGVEYKLTRTGDDFIPMEIRTGLASADTAAFLVSVHCDWYAHKPVNGTSTLYEADDAASADLAALLQSHITDGLGTADRGIHPHADIAILRDTQSPSVIVELAFMSNAHDLSLLKQGEFKEKAAENLAAGIRAALLLRAAD